jgi:fibronectin type III domain protein
MPKRKAKRQDSSSSRRRPGPRIVVAALLIASLFVAWTMLAYSGALDSVFPQKGDPKGPVSISSFNSNSPSKEYIYAGGRLIATEEPTGGGCASPSAPGTPTATALSTTSVSVSWAPSSGVDHYEVERRTGSGSFAVVASVSGTSTTDTSGVIADNAYLYRVRAFADPSGSCPSAYSGVDLATTTSFTIDAPVNVGSTIYAIHLLRLRTAVNAVRITAGLTTFDWGDSTPSPATVAPAPGGNILKDQMQKLRNALNEARTAPAIGLPPQSYSNEPLAAGIKVFANHILELRQGVQ